MTLYDRPELHKIFLSLERRLEVHFYTSNMPKFLQARVVFEKAGLILRYFKSKADPYNEDYSLNKELLLARGLEEVVSSIGSSYLLFVEDTSLRIEALSTPDVDYPGLSVKEWFLSTNFEQLDEQLKKKSAGRISTIKSDIALHVPWLKKPVFFHGESTGLVANSAPDFMGSQAYPWLTPNSFNGWFIPNGSSKRLGEMSFEESWKYDFRVRSLSSLIDRLEEYQAVLNLPNQSYSRVGRTPVPYQPSLFSEQEATYIVVGKTCAGKTTFGEHALQKTDFRFVEASSIIRTFKDEYPEELDSYQLAKNVLKSKGPDIVAKTILELYSTDLSKGSVITGFRTIEELELIKNYIPQAKIVLVESSDKTRFQRYIQRGRGSQENNIDDFNSLDERQWAFGLLRVAEDFADIKITNEGKMEEYLLQIDSVLSGKLIKDIPGVATDVSPRHETDHDQLYKALVALRQAGKSLDCGEIERITRDAGVAVRHNNANKVLKRVPELATRLETKGIRIRYEITDSGKAYLRFIETNTGDKKKKNE